MTTWNTATGATSGDRLLNVGLDDLHLSDGAQVFLDYDPDLTSPNQVSLKLAADHVSTPVVVASVSASTTSSGNFSLGSFAQSLAFAVDGSDNLYVVGQIGRASCRERV